MAASERCFRRWSWQGLYLTSVVPIGGGKDRALSFRGSRADLVGGLVRVLLKGVYVPAS